MIDKRIKGKGILTKLLENSVRILLIKECEKIDNLKIDITSSSTQIIKGQIQKINIIAENIYFKDLTFDEFELEANHLQINLKLLNKKIYFKNNPIFKFKISLSQNSLRKILSSKSWNWIGNIISKEILDQEKLEDIKIRNDQLLMKTSKDSITLNREKLIRIKTEQGKVFLENKIFNKVIKIPIEDKIYIKDVIIENNLINIFANSSISF